MKVLFVPMFSMRSYATGQYATLKDGNFQLSMSRILACDFESVVVCVPRDASDLDELNLKYKDLLEAGKISFRSIEYGENAVDTRKTFWGVNWVPFWCAEKNFDLLISDITGYKGLLPVVYNFNITKLPELDRPYIDQFWEQDLEAIQTSLFTTVLNPRQREYIVQQRPDLDSKVIVHSKCAHEDLMPKSVIQLASTKTIFWPFRISDKAYKWTEFLEAFKEQRLEAEGFTVVITDPNESSAELPAFVTKISPSKEEYYKILSSRPIVVMLDDIDTVLHPGTVEFFYYGCPVIAFYSDLIQNPNMIAKLFQLRSALNSLVYTNSKERMKSFVYKTGEIDSLYNQDFISEKIARAKD